MKPKPSLRLFLRLAAASHLVVSSAHAATMYWDGISSGWGTANNWSTSPTANTPNPNPGPGAFDIAVFNISTVNNAQTVTMDADRSILGITFNQTNTTAITANASGTTNRTLSLGNDGITINSGAGAVTLGNGGTNGQVLISLAAGAQTWTNLSANNLTINNTAATFTRAGGATLTFNQGGSGGFAIDTTELPNDATGIIGPWSFFGTGTSQRYAFNNAGTIAAYTGGTAAADAEAFTSATTNYDFSATGTTTLTTDRTAHTARYTGTGNIIDLGSSGANALTLNGLLAVGSSGSVTIQRSGTSTGSLVIGSGNDLVLAGTQDINISAPITGASGSLTYAGSGTLTLSGANTYGGATTVGSGTLVVDGASVLPTGTLVNIGNAVGTTFKINNTTTIGNLSGSGSLGTVALQGNTLTLGNATSTTYGGSFTGTSGSGIIKQGTGTLTLNTASSIPGTMTINNGIVLVSQGNLSGGAITLGANGATLQFGPNGSAGVNGLGGAVISNNIVVGSGVTSTGAKLWVNGNQGSWKFTGTITGAGSGAQTLLFDNRANLTTGGDRNTTTFSGVISDGSNGGNLSLSFLINPQTGGGTNVHPSYVNLTAANTFTGDITAARTVSLPTSGISTSWLVIGGELWADGGNNTPTYGKEGTGRLGANNGGDFTGNIKFGNSSLINLAYFSSANQTFSGVLGGASANNGALVKQGSGTLKLTNANTYSGYTTVSQGILDLGGGTANGSLASTVLNLNGGTLSYTRTGNTTQSFTTTNLTATGFFAGSASALSVVSGNTLNLGTIVSAGGTIDFGNTGAGTVAAETSSNVGGIIPGATFNGTNWAVANGTGVAISGYSGSYTTTTSAGNTAGNYTGNNISVDSSQTPGAVITPNSLRFNTSGAYTLTLTGTTNTVTTGGIMVNSAVGDNASTITGGSLLGSSNGSLLVVQNNTNSNGTLTIGSILANNGTASGLVKAGAGTLILTAANSYTGTTVINAGTLQIGNGGATGSLATPSGTAIINNGSLAVNRTGTLTLGMITGSGSVSNTGSTLTLNTLNDFSGGFTLHSGQITATTAGTFTGFGSGTVTINGGSFRFNSGGPTVSFNNNMVWNSPLTLSRATSGTPTVIFNGDITLGANSGYANGSTTESHAVVFNGDIGETGGSRSMTASVGTVGGNSMTFNGQNTFTGDINSNTNGPVTVGGSGYLGGGNYAGNISMGTGDFTYSSSADQILGGTISGSSATDLTKNTSSTSTLTLSGTNTYTGVTTVSAGTLQFAKTASLYNANTANWTAAKINVKSGATLAVNVDSAGTAGFTAGNLNTLLGAISVANTAVEGLQAGAKLGFDTSTATGGTFTQGNAIADSTGSGSFHGAIGLTKTGNGTLVLDKANTYTGPTTVAAGVLEVNGSLANTTTTVGNGGTLRGSGSIGGSVTVQNGGTIAAGNSIESLNIGALGLEAGSIFAYEMNNDALAGVAGDLTAVTGNLTFDLGNAAILMLTELGSGTWNVGEKLTLISYGGTWNNGLFTYLGGTLGDDSTFTFSGMDWMFNYNDTAAGSNFSGSLTNPNYVTMTVIPEPRAALLGGLGLLALLRRRRS